MLWDSKTQSAAVFGDSVNDHLSIEDTSISVSPDDKFVIIQGALNNNFLLMSLTNGVPDISTLTTNSHCRHRRHHLLGLHLGRGGQYLCGQRRVGHPAHFFAGNDHHLHHQQRRHLHQRRFPIDRHIGGAGRDSNAAHRPACAMLEQRRIFRHSLGCGTQLSMVSGWNGGHWRRNQLSVDPEQRVPGRILAEATRWWSATY